MQSTTSTDSTQFSPTVLLRKSQPEFPHSKSLGIVIILMVMAMFTWSVFSDIDIITTAPGKILPGAYAKTVTSPRLGVIHELKVDNGDVVKAGDPLVVLNTDTLNTELAKVEHSIEVHGDRVERFRALTGENNLNAILASYEAGMVTAKNLQSELLISEFMDFSRSIQHLDEQITALAAKQAVVKARISQTSAYLPLLRKKVKAQDELVKRGHQTEILSLDDRREYLRASREIGVLNRQVDEINQEISVRHAEKRLAESTFRKDTLDKLESETTSLEDLYFTRRKLKEKIDQSVIHAPVDGVIEELQIHSTERTVQETERLMKIVPTGQAIKIEALIPSGDIGFAKVGQKVRVKIDAYPFTRYGTVDGTLIRLSEDAAHDEINGWVFIATVKLDEDYFVVDGKRIKLSAGMTLQIDVVTGSRRVISYLLDPINEHIDRSLTER